MNDPDAGHSCTHIARESAIAEPDDPDPGSRRLHRASGDRIGRRFLRK